MNNSLGYASSHNPFVVAYHGLDLRNPALDKRIIASLKPELSIDSEERKRVEWFARQLGTSPAPHPSDKMKRLWADAMLSRYRTIPTEEQWWRDPIVSRLSAPFAEQVRPDVLRLSKDALEAGKKK